MSTGKVVIRLQSRPRLPPGRLFSISQVIWQLVPPHRDSVDLRIFEVCDGASEKVVDSCTPSVSMAMSGGEMFALTFRDRIA